MCKRLGLFWVILLAGLTSVSDSFATHLRAGEITVERLNCSRTFRITITVYTNTTGTTVIFGGGVLDFGDGSKPHVTAQDPGTARPDLGEGVSIVVYSTQETIHTYPGNGRYVISYKEANRNEGILNIANSVETTFYLETVINIDPFLGCSNSPRLLVPPIDKACTGAAWLHNPGAYDIDGDSLSYELTIPKQDKNIVVNAYRDPNNAEFYAATGKPYNQSNEEGTGPPTFSIDSSDGTITWDAPGAPGEYNIAFLIREWRQIGGVWVNTGYVTRDMQILVEDCDNERPELQVPADLCVVAGTNIIETITATDPDLDSVKIEAFGNVFFLNPSPASFNFLNAPPSQFNKPTIGNPVRGTFTWNTVCSHIKDQPYQIVFKATDNPGRNRGAKLVDFKTWNIKVVGPQPVWTSANVNLSNRSAVLDWQNYTCSNAVQMQVWRRVDSFPYTVDCQITGMPPFLGYQKIADLPIGTTDFIDTNSGRGLANGAQYCYRLVAVFPSPGGGESLVSEEICIDPIRADVPVITNVTVDETSTSTGKITIRWTRPFEADPAQFPPPYKYELQRAEGFSGEVRQTTLPVGNDTSFVDQNLNTEELPYNYKVIAKTQADVLVGTSVAASSVFLETKSQFKRIQLTWSAEVPWSINTAPFQRHLIYRGPENATNAQMILIDSVDVNLNQFVYVDSGQFQNTELVETQEYCYRVLTRGAYGNPRIDEPLLNYSQRACAIPADDEPPCAIVLEPAAIDCAEFLENASCNNANTVFSNTLSWRRPADPVCRADVRSYRIYVASRVGGEFSLLVENVRDTFYVHRNLASFANCYKISAVDRGGNESELSEQVCFDNCPNYELPNVFTPNADGCNDLFSAFSIRNVGEGGLTSCGVIEDLPDFSKKCARFVVKVEFKVYNRWGKEAYTYTSGGENTIYIDWNGKDNRGNDLATGVYFYSANVTFDVVDPSQAVKTIKGWVHLIR
jgi:hypothetical protein